MAILDILVTPDPRLRIISKPVKDISAEITTLIDNMLETMYSTSGIGLAAPQVNVHKNIMVIDLLSTNDNEHPSSIYPLSIINPKIVAYSQSHSILEEGCLSVPEKFLAVRRPTGVTLKYLDVHGEIKTIASIGWLSRVIQHEYDHLIGRLIIDYLETDKVHKTSSI